MTAFIGWILLGTYTLTRNKITKIDYGICWTVLIALLAERAFQ